MEEIERSVVQGSSSGHEIVGLLESALEGKRLERHDTLTLLLAGPEQDGAIRKAAARLRDAGHGRTITYSAKVFVPLTTLCRDDCSYCTFRRDPGEPGAKTLEPDEVRDLALSGARLGAKEALVSLGDRPEARFPEHRAWLARWGFGSTLEYVAHICELVALETPLLPHANPGVMGERELTRLLPTCPSMGLMLETTSHRLLEPGQAHERAPDKAPSRRLATLQAAGNLRIPFTTGILVGIGETLEERADALLALRQLRERYGHVQEIIIQNFRAKASTRMRNHPAPSPREFERTVAVARLVLGPKANLQAPPNLSDAYPDLLGAGINDWGGISPLTLDHINPEAPWPALTALRDKTRALGYELRERLTVYPEFVREHAPRLDPRVRDRLLARVDADGLVPRGEEAFACG